MQERLERRPESFMVGLFAAIQFCHILDFVIMMPLGPRLMSELDLSTRQFGLLVSSYSISAAVAGIVVATMVDRFERRRALFFLFSGFILATLACGLSPSYHALLASRILAGCFGGVVGACVFAIMGDVIAPHRRGRAMGVVMSSFSVASVAGVPVGLALAGRWGWNMPFLALGACSAAVAATIFFILPRLDSHLPANPSPEVGATQPVGDPPALRHYLQALLETAAWPSHRLCFVMIAFLMMSGFFVIPFIATLLVHNYALSASDLPLVYFFGGTGTVVSALIIGRCTDAFGHLRSLTAVALMSLVPVALLCHGGASGRGAIFVLMTTFMMFVSGRMVPAMALVTAASDPKKRGTFMSLFTSVQAGSMGLAALIGGQIVTELPDGRLAGFPTLGYLYIAASAAAVLAARQVARRARFQGS